MSGSGQTQRGQSQDAGREFFLCMTFIILGTHASFAALWLAYQLSASSVAMAAVASWFWMRGWNHGLRAESLFEDFPQGMRED